MPSPTCQKTPSTTDPPIAELATAARHMGGATLVSRVLGFVRDILIARYFGTGAAAEAFVVAFRIPNLFRELVAEGAASAAIVPTLSAAHTRQTPQRWTEIINVVATTMAVFLGLAVCMAVIGAPLLVRLLAPGFARNPFQWTLTVDLTRVLLPYLWMMGLVAVTTSALHVLRHFQIPAWNPVYMNVCVIVACLLWVPQRTPAAGIMVVAYSILCAGAIQVCANLMTLWRLRVPVRPRWEWGMPELAHIGRLMLPRLFGSAVYQLGVLLDTLMASLAWIVGTGGVAALYYASRLVQFPLGLFGVSVSTVLLPTLSQQAARQEHDLFRATLLVGLRTITAVMLPAAVGLFLLAEPIVGLLFERGAFQRESTQMTAWVLQWSAVGLWAFAITKLLVSAHYALHDTRTPVRWSALGLGCNLVFNFLLMYPMGVGGLALGTSLAASIECLALWRSIERRIGHLNRRLWWSACGRLLMATVGMGCWTWWAGHVITPSAIGLMGVVMSSVMVYGVMARVLHAEELGWLIQRLSKRA